MTSDTRLQDRAVLAGLSIGVWSGFAHDKQVTEEVSESHKAEKDAGRYSKRLVAGKFINHVAGVARQARSIHNILTLPWQDDGTRIMSTSGYEHYSDQMRTCRIKFNAAAKEFIAGMPEYIKEAQVRLGTMFDHEDYPDNAELKDKFSFDVEIRDVPEAQDFRAKLSDASVKAIVADIERRTNERLANAMNDAFERVFDVTNRMATTLKEYKPPKDGKRAEGNFTGSLISNIAEIANMLPALNITGDTRLDALKDELLNGLVDYSPEVLKSDPKERFAAAKAAAEIAKKVKSYLA